MTAHLMEGGSGCYHYNLDGLLIYFLLVCFSWTLVEYLLYAKYSTKYWVIRDKEGRVSFFKKLEV